MPQIVKEVIKKYPKLRGYKFNPKAKKIGLEFRTVNLDVLDKNFKDGEKVTPSALVEKNMILVPKKGKVYVKILG